MLQNFVSKLLQIAVGFAVNQISFTALVASEYVLAMRLTAMHDNLGAFWSPFMVRWQHGHSGVSLHSIYQALILLITFGTVLAVAIDLGFAPLPTLVVAVLSVSTYVLYKRLFQLAYTHLVTVDRVAEAIRTNLIYNICELALIVGVLTMARGTVSATFRFGVIGVLGVVVTWHLLTRLDLTLTAREVVSRPATLAGELISNTPLLLHNLVLVGYFYLLKVLMPSRLGLEGDSEAALLYCVTMAQTYSGVLYSFTEFIRPQVFKWGNKEARFPVRDVAGLLGLFLVASAAYVSIGFLIVRGLSRDRLPSESLHDWIICGIGALLLGAGYCVDVVSIAKKRYRELASCSLFAICICCLLLVFAPNKALLAVVVFPASRSGIQILSLWFGIRRPTGNPPSG